MILREDDGEWTLDATSVDVTRVCLDSRLSLLLTSELGDAEIHCNGEFRVIDRKRGIDAVVSAADEDVPAWGSFRGDLDSMMIARNGRLQLNWVSGIQLVAEPDDGFEAWELTSDRLQLVCSPGGGITVFDAQD